MIVFIDNYDSFTYNLYQYIREVCDEELKVIRNDVSTVENILNENPSHIIISPGPGWPEQAGITVELIKAVGGRIPILGVCLGLQSIAIAYDMKVIHAKEVIHGKTDIIEHDGKGIFRSVKASPAFTRYHSLAVDAESIHPDFEISARSADGEIMAMRHKEHIIEGVQFHPESIASEEGKKLLRNFLYYRREPFVQRKTLNNLLSGTSLSIDEAKHWMEEVTSGNISPVFLTAFLIAFNVKNISPQELAGAAQALYNNAKKISAPQDLIDTCGTGGDGKGSFNISSITALLAAACGLSVAKHGNRAVSSQCGSADFYHALGIPIDLQVKEAETLLEKTNFTFLFAPIYHPSMRYAAPVRKELGIKTIMNLIGPLTNPAKASHRLIGVYDMSMSDVMVQAARLLDIKRALVFSTEDGMDEISVIEKSHAYLLSSDGAIEPLHIDPKRYIISDYSEKDLRGGSAEENAKQAWKLAKNKGTPALRDAMLLNTAAALFVSEKVQSIQDGWDMANEVLQAGKLKDKIEEIIDSAQRLQSNKG